MGYDIGCGPGCRSVYDDVVGSLQFDTKMSDAEALMWRLEKDPHLSSTFANIMLLDRVPDMARLRRRLEAATRAIPRLRQRVRPAPGGFSPPSWVEDHEFDIDYHLRHISLPRPSSVRHLLDVATQIVADPFDRNRPLWQFTVVQGIGGRAAIIEKLHHTIADGERGVELSLSFLDFERDASEPTGSEAGSTSASAQPDEPSTPGLIRDALIGGLRFPLGVMRQVSNMVTDPAQVPATTAAFSRTARGIMAQLAETERARSPLWTQRSIHRHLEVTRAPFRETKDAAKSLGGTLNTAFLTAAAEAASRYHDAMDTPVEYLRASMAISTRTEESGANAFSLVRMLVPTAPMPIAERFRAIHEISEVARRHGESAQLDTVATLAGGLPTSVITRLARQQAETVDFATSNVRGSPVPVYVAGAKLLENYPVGPLAGVAFNLTLLSYMGSLDTCANIDTAAIADPKLLARNLKQSFAALIAT